MIALLLTLSALGAPGGVCPPIAGGRPELAAIDASVRADYLARVLEEESSRAFLWSAVWGGGYGVLTVGQLAITPLQNDDDRLDGYVGAASAAIGTLEVVLMPLAVISDGRDLEARAKARREELGLCPALAELETTFASDAEDEASSVAWPMHLGNVAFNLGVGALLGFGFHHWLSAGLNVGLGILVGEVMFFTQPTRLGQVLEDYRAGRLEDGPPPSLTLTPIPRGLALAFSF